jgi:EAL domain-containing protein (putative c-di-GMP-specific phosphodiesterase class I)
MDEAMSQRRRLAEDLRAAIDKEELTLHYQPIADLETGSIVGFEALLRWFHPNLGSVSPDLFVRIAEETGLIIKLGEWVIREAFEEAAAWDKPLKLSVNLSPLQFIRKDLARFISAALSDSGLDPARLEVEVTEGILISDNDLARDLLDELRAMGIQISLDDFGTGFSSLGYFRNFQFDKVKVDKSFVSDIATNDNARAIIRSIVNLGRNLGMVVVAEGVETEEQLEALRADGCTQVQGFLIGRPNPIGFAEGIVVKRRGKDRAASRVIPFPKSA